LGGEGTAADFTLSADTGDFQLWIKAKKRVAPPFFLFLRPIRAYNNGLKYFFNMRSASIGVQISERISQLTGAISYRPTARFA
jgi:hypothetical protein